MNIIQLKCFQTVANEEHLTRASNVLNISQPALSVLISKLEEEVGVPLFDRTGRSIRLNDFGKIYLKYVNEALSSMDHANKEIADLKSRLESCLTLGITGFVATQDMIKTYMQNHPVKVKQNMLMPHDISKELKNGSIDFAITSISATDEFIDSAVLLRQKILLAVNRKHPFAKRKSIDLIEAKDEGFVCLPNGYAYRIFTDNLCMEAGFKQNVVFEYFQSQLLEMVSSGIGIGIAIDYPERNSLYKDSIAFLEITNPLRTRDVSLQWNKERYVSKTAASFRKYAVDYYNI